MKFEELGLNQTILEAIGYMGFEKASPIQEQAIPIILDKDDLIGCAQTGTGKTAAFTLPILHDLCEKKEDFISTLIICPTRELALQIDQQIQAFSYFAGVSSFPVYGGGDASDWDKQKKALTSGTDIIVATPGKLLDFIMKDYVKMDQLQHLILDEADRMLDMGFIDDILRIISYLPKERQTLLFSATMDPKLRELAGKILKPNPKQISIAIAKPAEGVLQAAYCVHDDQKIDLINSLITNKPNYESILVFSSTKAKVKDIIKGLKNPEYEIAGISSDFDQKEREEVLLKFASKRTRVLVATDVISRGIDIKDINLVINFDVPNDAADYVHRVGRTARASTTGVALSLINRQDMVKFGRIEQLIEREIPKLPLPEAIGEGPNYNPNWKDRKKKSFKKRR